MNMQLTLANAEHTAADRKWREHKRDCPKCSTAQRSRKPVNMCRAGGELYGTLKACEADLARERELDKLPCDGQGELFTRAESGPERSRRDRG